MHEPCLIIIHDPGMRLGPESNRGLFGLADECSTTELTLSPKYIGYTYLTKEIALPAVSDAAVEGCGFDDD